MNDAWKQKKKQKPKRGRKRASENRTSKSSPPPSSSARGGARKKNKTTKQQGHDGLMQRRLHSLVRGRLCDPSSTFAYQRTNTNLRIVHKNPSEQLIKVLFFATFELAYQAEEQIKAEAETCDQLNVVIEQEGSMTDPQLLSYSTRLKLFAGEAWSLIHKRRQQDGWYAAPADRVEENQL